MPAAQMERRMAKIAAAADLVADVPSPMAILLGRNHLIVVANRSFARQIGRSVHDLVGSSLGEAVPEATDRGSLAILDDVLRSGTAWHRPAARATREDGADAASPALFITSATPLSEDGDAYGILVRADDTAGDSPSR